MKRRLQAATWALVTPEIECAAVDAELRQRGAGLAFISSAIGQGWVKSN